MSRFETDSAMIARQGFLDLAPPNPDTPAPEAYQLTPGSSSSSFWPGLVVQLPQGEKVQVQNYPVKPYAPIVPETDPHTDLPIDRSETTVFGNTFLLGLRTFGQQIKGAGFEQSTGTVPRTPLLGPSAPAGGGPGARLALTPRPWVYPGRATRIVPVQPRTELF